MKVSVTLLVCVVIAFVTLTQVQGKNCLYDEGDWSPCVSGEKKQILTLQESGGVDCKPQKLKVKPCGRAKAAGNKRKGKRKNAKMCKYDKKVQWSECDVATNLQNRTIKLKEPKEGCKPEKFQRRECRKDCQYIKGNWGDCNQQTNMRRRILTLSSGDPSSCAPTKIREKKCRKGKPCKYRRGTWSQCDPSTNMMQQTMTLKRGDKMTCEAHKTITKRCKRRAALTAARGRKCKYTLTPWGACNLRTNTMTRSLQLKHGDPADCPLSKELRKKCKRPCKFRKGLWSACDRVTVLMTRVDVLIKGNQLFCDKTRTMTKNCKSRRSKCQYDFGSWSDCDLETNMRTRVKKLISGDPKVCQKTVELRKACTRSNGKERCFFGAWGEFGPCMNGVITKHRPVIQGGTDCDRKAVKTRACGDPPDN